MKPAPYPELQPPEEFKTESTEQTPNEAHNPRLDWWRQARFGAFIHWGPYSLLAGKWNDQAIDNGIGHGVGEWIMYNAQIPVIDYAKIAQKFNPTAFNADAWVKLIKLTGQKYLIITAKHHDGFALYNSQVSPFNVANTTAFGRDIIAELASACARHNIRFGIYYSHAQDWHHPGGAAFNGRDDPTAPWSGGDPAAGRWDTIQDGDFDTYLNTIAQPQVRELLTHYGKVDILWWDTPIGMTPERAEAFQEILQLQPNIITNNRLLNPDTPNPFSGDTETPEQHIPASMLLDRNFEVCMTINDTWGFKANDHNWKSSRDLIRQLVDTASKGGNFLLNLGPDGTGRIPEACIERMNAIGRWMTVNGEAIEGTEASPFNKLPWGRCTRRHSSDSHSLYLHVFNWPADGTLLVPGLHTPAKSASLLATGDELKLIQYGDNMAISLPTPPPDPAVSVVHLLFDSAPIITQTLPRLTKAAPIELSAWMASIHNNPYKDQTILNYDRTTPIIQNWTDPECCLTWDIEVKSTGLIRVILECESSQEGSCFKVSLGGTSTKTKLTKQTGSQNATIAHIHTSQTGKLLLTLQPVAKNWTAPSLTAVHLQFA